MNCPASLLEMQRWVAKIVSLPLRELDEDGLPIYDEAVSRETEIRISCGPHLTANQRIGLYNQQYWFRYFTTLQEQYPVLTRLFGFNGFNREIAEPYLLCFPSSHWAILRLGDRLPHWIKEEYREGDKMLVYETALVDAAYESLYRAASLPSLDLKDFARAKMERLFLQPSVQIVSLHADLFVFRAQMLQYEPEHWITADFPTIEWGEERFFVFSHEAGHEEISHDEMLLLSAFKKGAILRVACKGLSAAAEKFIAEWFRKWVQRGWLVVDAYTAPHQIL